MVTSLWNISTRQKRGETVWIYQNVFSRAWYNASQNFQTTWTLKNGMKRSKNKQIMNFTMLGLCKAVKWQARTTLMSGNVHENCKVGKTSYRPINLRSSKITETKRESGGTQRNLRFSQLSLGGVAKAHAESCIFFWCWVMCQIFVLSWGLPPVKYLPFLVMPKGTGLSRKHQTHRVTARTLQVGSTGHSLADTDWGDGTTRCALL